MTLFHLITAAALSCRRPRSSVAGAFTLAELIIALIIVGIIATLTVAGVNKSPSNKKALAATQAAAMEVQSAYTRYLLDYELMPEATFATFLPYLASRTQPYTGTLNSDANGGSLTCGSGDFACAKLSNGAVIAYKTNLQFAQASASSTVDRCIPVIIDPDGKFVDSYKSFAVYLVMEYGGRLETTYEMPVATCNSYNITTAADVPINGDSIPLPDWWSWQSKGQF
jgi:prepilin-type N-terminal cleavage/methylation domain-containing protein